MTKLALIIAAASLLLAPPPLVAQEDGGGGEADEATPASEPQAPVMPAARRAGGPAYRPGAKPKPAAVPAAPREAAPDEAEPENAGDRPSTEGQALGGVGLGTFGNRERMPAAGGSSAGRGGGGGPSGGDGGGAAGRTALKVYDSYADVPRPTRASHGGITFAGPGSGAAVRFRAKGQASGSGYMGLWSWVETAGSSDGCYYKAWFSIQPGGAPVSGCGPVETQWTGGAIHWKAGVKPLWYEKCELKAGADYYFNLMLSRKGAETDACQEYIQPN